MPLNRVCHTSLQLSAALFHVGAAPADMYTSAGCPPATQQESPKLWQCPNDVHCFATGCLSLQLGEQVLIHSCVGCFHAILQWMTAVLYPGAVCLTPG